MKYIQPFGISDEDASYINGNPNTGTMGSIPPAAAIEYPQREIVNFITDSGIAPDNSDLRQLGRSVQNGRVNFDVDAGTVNQVQVTLEPPPIAITVGMVVRFKAAVTPTGSTTLNVNALGPKLMKGRNGADIKPKDWLAGDIVTAVYDGVNFQVAGGATDAYPRLQASADYYVATTGSDTLNDGLDPSTPFLTLQRAVTASQQFNLNGFSINIHMADGFYPTANSTYFPPINGSGAVNITGNPTTPSNCSLQSSAGTCLMCSAGGYFFNGFKLTCLAGIPGDPGRGIAVNDGNCYISNIDFGQCADGCVLAGGGGSLMISGAIKVVAAAQVNFAQTFMGGYVTTNPVDLPSLNLVAGTNFSRAFGVASFLGVTALNFGSVTGTATGYRYQAGMNGCVSGPPGGNLPGSLAGTLATGGQYQ